MKFFAFLLIVSVINLSLTNGQETCRQWKEDKSTELLDAFGHWYTYLEDKNLVKPNDLCSEYEFSWNASINSVNLLNTQHKADNSVEIIKGIAKRTKNQGVLDVNYENGLVFQGKAVSMNEKYILFTGCFKQKDFIRIVTKETNPSDEIKQIIEDKIVEQNIDRSKLIYSCRDF